MASSYANSVCKHYGRNALEFVKGPTEEQSHDARDKTSEKFEFVAHKKGVHKFCFTNKSPYHETLDFDIHVGHFTYFELHAKDEHFNPLVEQISKLKEALYNIQLEQHWLEATTDRQAVGNNLSCSYVVVLSFAALNCSLMSWYLQDNGVGNYFFYFLCWLK
ncbi:hypothetical protein MKW98_008328 [Papaver atlanticum]|uniref:GOLD domain-containing protein n=1 Tax=Papaver atlanticum TaxID=357466 RepID=A0AAD4TCE6_9MAGN|nr:hypothetical protein MKW98_008328 [Papaver atlanticum]